MLSCGVLQYMPCARQPCSCLAQVAPREYLVVHTIPLNTHAHPLPRSTSPHPCHEDFEETEQRCNTSHATTPADHDPTAIRRASQRSQHTSVCPERGYFTGVELHRALPVGHLSEIVLAGPFFFSKKRIQSKAGLFGKYKYWKNSVCTVPLFPAERTNGKPSRSPPGRRRSYSGEEIRAEKRVNSRYWAQGDVWGLKPPDACTWRPC